MKSHVSTWSLRRSTWWATPRALCWGCRIVGVEPTEWAGRTRSPYHNRQAAVPSSSCLAGRKGQPAPLSIYLFFLFRLFPCHALTWGP
jgi:hypothetical protein